MATCIWLGDAEAVAKVMTATPANVEVDDVFTLTCAGESVSFTATAATVANVCTGLAAAWNASTVTEHAEITAADPTPGSSTYITLTCDTAGVEFTVTSSTTDGGGNDTQTLTMATSTAAAGPNVWSDADNWSNGAVPANGDDVIFEHSGVDCLYGLSQSGVSLASLTIKASYTGNIGLPERNSAGYDEYRDTYLDIDATALTVGEGDGNGSGRIKIDNGAETIAVVVYSTGSRIEQYVPSLLIKSTGPGNTLTVYDGDVGWAFFGADSGNLDDVWIGPAGSAQLHIGSGVTVDAGAVLNVYGGQVMSESNLIAPTVRAGSLEVIGDATVTTLTVAGGTCYYKSSGTITTLDVQRGTADFRGLPQSRTVTNATINRGATIRDPFGTVTWTNGVDCVECSPTTCTLDLVHNRTWTPTAI